MQLLGLASETANYAALNVVQRQHMQIHCEPHPHQILKSLQYHLTCRVVTHGLMLSSLCHARLGSFFFVLSRFLKRQGVVCWELWCSSNSQMVSLELARVAERAERYDDMADYMQARVMEGQALDTEERDMFPS